MEKGSENTIGDRTDNRAPPTIVPTVSLDCVKRIDRRNELIRYKKEYKNTKHNEIKNSQAQRVLAMCGRNLVNSM